MISTFLVADHIDPVCANIESPLEPELPDEPLEPEVPLVPDVADAYDKPPIVIPFVKLAEPDTIISSAKTTLFPPELNILNPS